jgi:glycosyltransferase involved in cell wall biosynthesis
VIIGATGLTWPSFSSGAKAKVVPLPNVHFLGRKPFREALAYMREFNVAIIPHLQNDFNRNTNPLKLYEYLALGKPVVMTPQVGLEEVGDLVRVADTPEQFNRQVLAALRERGTGSAERRKQFVQGHSWANRVNTMLTEVVLR